MQSTGRVRNGSDADGLVGRGDAGPASHLERELLEFADLHRRSEGASIYRTGVIDRIAESECDVKFSIGCDGKLGLDRFTQFLGRDLDGCSLQELVESNEENTRTEAEHE